MSRGDYDPPVLAPEGPSTVGTGQWVYVPTRRSGRFAKWKNPIGIAGAIIIGLTVFVALFGKYIWAVDPDELVSTRLQDPSWAHPLGTDELGRDTLARIIHGAQVSLQVGFISVEHRARPRALARTGVRLLHRQDRHLADADRRPDVRPAGARARDRDRRPARAEPAERDDRDRDRDSAGVRARRARQLCSR